MKRPRNVERERRGGWILDIRQKALQIGKETANSLINGARPIGFLYGKETL